MEGYTVFEPGSPLLDMRDEYEELNSIAGIETLEERQIRFAWFYASKTSPYAKKTDRERKALSITAAYRREKSEKKAEIEKMKISDLPDALQNVIEFFSKNNVNVRVRSKLMMEKTFQDIEAMIFAFDADDKDSDNAGYVSAVKNALSLTPDIIKMIEGGGLGVKKSRRAVASNDDEPNIEDV